MLSKSKGQVLRVAAALHIFFQDEIDTNDKIKVSEVENTLSNEAILAAKNFVEICCQHASFMGGRGIIDDEIKSLSTGKPPLYNKGLVQ